MVVQILARAVIRAADIHENSWSPVLASYQASKHDSAVQATLYSPELQPVVYMLLTNSWNESIDWASKGAFE